VKDPLRPACTQLARPRAELARIEARFLTGRLRQAYWRGVRPGPGWRGPAAVCAIRQERA
jgi:hypothetical protein